MKKKTYNSPEARPLDMRFVLMQSEITVGTGSGTTDSGDEPGSTDFENEEGGGAAKGTTFDDYDTQSWDE